MDNSPLSDNQRRYIHALIGDIATTVEVFNELLGADVWLLHFKTELDIESIRKLTFDEAGGFIEHLEGFAAANGVDIYHGRSPKQEVWRDKKTTVLCSPRLAPYCMFCKTKSETLVPAHANDLEFGKGRGLKASDATTVPACMLCHKELDQGSSMTREEKSCAHALALRRWHVYLLEKGMLIINPLTHIGD